MNKQIKRNQMNESQKAKHLIDNHSSYNLSWDDLVEKTGIPKSTLTGLKSYPKRLKTSRWELIHTLAKEDDKLYLNATFGDKPELIKTVIGTIVDQHVPGDDPISLTIRSIIKESPLALAEIAESLDNEEQEGDKDEKKS